MWQVFRKTSDGYESWDVELEGESFDTEEKAERRAEALDRSNPWASDWHFVREIPEVTIPRQINIVACTCFDEASKRFCTKKNVCTKVEAQ